MDQIRGLGLGVFHLRLSWTVPSGAPFVSLGASPETVRGGGGNVNVTCTALGEPEEDVSFSWSYPGQVRDTRRKLSRNEEE